MNDALGIKQDDAPEEPSTAVTTISEQIATLIKKQQAIGEKRSAAEQGYKKEQQAVQVEIDELTARLQLERHLGGLSPIARKAAIASLREN